MKDLSMHIMDLVQNSVRAKSENVVIAIEASSKKEILSIEIRDDGSGMSEETLIAASDPFGTSRKTRKIGLGLPLFKQATVAGEGNYHIESKVGEGTIVRGEFRINALDRQPLGDIGNLIFLLGISGDSDFKLEIISDENKSTFEVKKEDKFDLDRIFGVQDEINIAVNEMFGGVLPEIGESLL